jgi:ligand-binding sensor domain-containing protein
VASPNLHELQTDRITAVAAADDGGLWLGTAQGLFHLDQRVLARDSTAHGVR